MAKKKKGHSGGGGSSAKFFLKLGASLIGGAVIGEVISPVLPRAISGPALGVAVVGLPVWGMKRSFLTHALAPAVAIQALKTASESQPISIARASVANSAAAIGPGGTVDELELARRAARGG